MAAAAVVVAAAVVLAAAVAAPTASAVSGSGRSTGTVQSPEAAAATLPPCDAEQRAPSPPPVGFATVKVPGEPHQWLRQQQQQEQQYEPHQHQHQQQQPQQPPSEPKIKGPSAALRALLAGGPGGLAKCRALALLVELIEYWGAVGEAPSDGWWGAVERWARAAFRGVRACACARDCLGC